jgi:phosphate transport system permease protein
MSPCVWSNAIVKHMNNATIDPTPTDWDGTVMQKRIAKRYAAERRFKALGFFSVALSTLFLAFLLFTMLGQGLRIPADGNCCRV